MVAATGGVELPLVAAAEVYQVSKGRKPWASVAFKVFLERYCFESSFPLHLLLLVLQEESAELGDFRWWFCGKGGGPLVVIVPKQRGRKLNRAETLNFKK